MFILELEFELGQNGRVHFVDLLHYALDVLLEQLHLVLQLPVLTGGLLLSLQQGGELLLHLHDLGHQTLPLLILFSHGYIILYSHNCSSPLRRTRRDGSFYMAALLCKAALMVDWAPGYLLTYSVDTCIKGYWWWLVCL